MERARSWWTGTSYFRCQTCQWRGPLRDEWNVARAFPDVKPLKLSRELDIEALEERDEQAIVDLLLGHREELGCSLRVWLDDSRPAPAGWMHLRSVEAVQQLLTAHLVRELSLDHDLGWCADCIREGQHLRKSGKRHCPHTATGYDLCVWMSDTGTWPALPPAVHSGNLEGGARMLGLIARHWADIPAETPKSPRPGATGFGAPMRAAGEGGAAKALIDQVKRRWGRDLTATSQLTTCGSCGARSVIRSTRGSTLSYVLTMVTRRYPVRCQACGWSKWVREPILVRLSSSAESPAEELDRREFDAIEPEE
jgi:hypothetical protein